MSNVTSDDHTARYYDKLINNRLSAWHKYVPSMHTIGQKNCWCLNNHKAPPSGLRRSLSYWVNLDSIRKKYSIAEAQSIVGYFQNDITSFSSFGTSTCSEKATLSQTLFCLPQVYLIGFPKCGTTSLYSYLTSDKSISIPCVKEGQFWRGFAHIKDDSKSDTYFQLSVLHYLYQYKGVAYSIANSNHTRLIDASATTSYDFAHLGLDLTKDTCFIPTLLSKALPSIKIIVIMRDPVNRLWSHYWAYCSENWKRSSDGEIVVPANIATSPAELFHNHSVSIIKKFLQCVKLHSEFDCLTFSRGYACEQPRLSVSLYYMHIVKWLSVFPREQFHFLRMEDLKQELYSEMKKLWIFLDTRILSEDAFKSAISHSEVESNTNDWIRSERYHHIFQMWPETKQFLQSFFHPYNQRLARLLNDNRFLWHDF